MVPHTPLFHSKQVLSTIPDLGLLRPLSLLPPLWPRLHACRRGWLCAAWVFITTPYTSLVPSCSGLGACHFDVAPASCRASGLHMEGWASEPVPSSPPPSPLLLLRSCSGAQRLPDSVFPLGALHSEGLMSQGLKAAPGRSRKPWHQPALEGKRTGPMFITAVAESFRLASGAASSSLSAPSNAPAPPSLLLSSI